MIVNWGLYSMAGRFMDGVMTKRAQELESVLSEEFKGEVSVDEGSIGFSNYDLGKAEFIDRVADGADEVKERFLSRYSFEQQEGNRVKQIWIAAFSENGVNARVTLIKQVQVGKKRRQESCSLCLDLDFWKSPEGKELVTKADIVCTNTILWQNGRRRG